MMNLEFFQISHQLSGYVGKAPCTRPPLAPSLQFPTTDPREIHTCFEHGLGVGLSGAWSLAPWGDVWLEEGPRVACLVLRFRTCNG